MNLLIVDFSETVESMKLRIATTTGVPVRAQTLIIRGKHLKDCMQLRAYKLSAYDVIYLHQNLCGGAVHEACPDSRCKCSQHNVDTGCCAVCRCSCQCASCKSEVVNSIERIRANKVLCEAAMNNPHGIRPRNSVPAAKLEALRQ